MRFKILIYANLSQKCNETNHDASRNDVVNVTVSQLGDKTEWEGQNENTEANKESKKNADPQAEIDDNNEVFDEKQDDEVFDEMLEAQNDSENKTPRGSGEYPNEQQPEKVSFYEKLK